MSKINEYEYANLSRQVYDSIKLSLEDKGYKIAKKHNFKFLEASVGPETGRIISSQLVERNGNIYLREQDNFFAVAFERDGEIVIAFRGTTVWKDVVDDFALAHKALPKERFDKAVAFYEKIGQKYGYDKISFTGHSLGGFDANLLAVHTGKKSITFDAPGIKEIATTQFSSGQISKADITNFIAGINLINGVNQHVGKVVHMEISKPIYEPSYSSLLSLTLKEHPIEKILDSFDKTTGKVSVPHKELVNYGGNLNTVATDYLSYDKNKHHWDQVMEGKYKKLPESEKHGTSFEEFKAKFIETELIENDDFYSSVDRTKKVTKFVSNLKGIKEPGNHIVALKAFSKDAVVSFHSKLEDVVARIKKGEKINSLQLAEAKAIARDYFSELKATGSEDAPFHLSFVANNGHIGKIANNVFERQAILDGVGELKVKTDIVKVLLAYEHAKVVLNSGNSKLTAAQSHTVREQVFKSQGFSAYSDLCKLVDTISASNGKCYQVKSPDDISKVLKSTINYNAPKGFGLIGTNVVSLPENIGGLQSLRAVNAVKDGILSTISPDQKKIALGPVMAANKESVAKAFGVKPEMVKPKYADKPDSDKFLSGNFNKLYEVTMPQSVVHNPKAAVKDQSSNFSDPEFITRLMVAPMMVQGAEIYGVTTLDPKALLPKHSVTVASANTDNGKLKIEIDTNFSTVHKKLDMSQQWQNGLAIHGSQFEVRMPANILNGNGAKNVLPSSIVTDLYRPGAHQISDFDTTKEIVRITANAAKLGPVKFAASMNNCQTSSVTKLNIDPLLIDLSGRGIEVTSYKDNMVMFDIDGDGFLEETGWAGPNTGILVVDLNGNGIIDNIKEIVSEKFEGIEAKDGFEALRRHDLNKDGVVDEKDPIFNKLRVWINKSGDGITKKEELFTLPQLGIKSIVVNPDEIAQTSETMADNTLKARGYCVLTSGEKREVASVDFTANPNGHKFEETSEGIVVVSESGTKSYTAKNKASGTLDAAKLGVKNIYSSGMGDTLVASGEDNWLVSRGGSNTYIATKGDNTLVVTAEDKLENIRTSGGFNNALITGSKGMYFDLKKTGIHVLTGSNFGDIIDASACDYNAFIQTGDGNNIAIGSLVTSAVSGGRGDDVLIGQNDSLLRAHTGNNILMATTGNNYLEGGAGFNLLIGGSGKNVFACGSDGYNVCEGGNGQLNIANFPGNISDYKFEKQVNGDLIVTDLRSNCSAIAVLKNIHLMNFANISSISENTIIASTSYVEIDESPDKVVIKDEELIANHPILIPGVYQVTEISDVKGGEVKIEYHANKIAAKTITFIPDSKYKGIMSFSYILKDEKGKESTVTLTSDNEFNGLTGKSKSQVFLKKPSYPDDELFYHQYYLSENNIFNLWQEYTGKGVKVAVVEPGNFDADHPDLKSNALISNNNSTELSIHATAVAGVIAAAITGQGGVGVAPEASLLSKRVNLSSLEDKSPMVNEADIINCSYGYSKKGWHSSFGLSKAVPDEMALLKDIIAKIENGRGGLGTIVVFASGNDRQENGSSNYCMIKSLPYMVVVGGINKETDIGKLEKPYKPFSNAGANILVSAPCYQIHSASLQLKNPYNSTFGNIYNQAQGTSFSTPIVSGVIALMLQANPFLGLRDVQKILTYSAKIIDQTNSKWEFNHSKFFNGGGLHFSYDYGFGNVDATAAVRLAETWVSQNVKFKTLPITLRQGGFTEFSQEHSFTCNVKMQGFQVEKIVLDLQGQNIKLDEATILINSSHRTCSILSEARKLTTPNGEKFTLEGVISPSTNHFFDEDVVGPWEIKILAANDGVDRSTLTTATSLAQLGKMIVTLVGSLLPNNVFIFTNEAAQFYNNERSVLESPTGLNTINAAPVESAVEVNLGQLYLKIMSNKYTIAPNTKVYNVFGGQSDNQIIGNDLDNILIGGKGSNIIKGIAGHNILSTGKGSGDIYSGKDADMFVIRKNPNTKIAIHEYKTNLEKEVINIVGFGQVKSFTDLQMYQKGSDVVIDLERQSLTLTGTSISNLSEKNFLFNEHFNFHAQFSGDHIDWNSSLEHAIYG